MSRDWLRYVALAEATSFLCLLVATVVKYAFDAPGGVQLLGPIHGVLFIAYVGLVLYERSERG
jgi:integral membrane protein